MKEAASLRSVPADGHQRRIQPLRLGFIGLGWIGRSRLSAVSEAVPTAELVLFDPDAGAREQALLGASGTVSASCIDDLLDRNLDGVVIATPNMLHEDQCLAALERGCGVFCQKPLAPTARQARRIVEKARERDALLAVDWSYRHLQGVKYATRSVREGGLGEIVGIDLAFHNAWGPDGAWFYERELAGGGCVVDLGVHLLDLAMTLAGEDLRCVASHVTAAGAPLGGGLGTPVEDFAWATLRAGDGPAVRIACSWRAHMGTDCVIRCGIHGTKGGITIENINGSFFDFRTGHHTSTAAREVARDDKRWGGGAILEWARRLHDGEGFDPEVERAVRIGELVEEIYGKGMPCGF